MGTAKTPNDNAKGKGKGAKKRQRPNWIPEAVFKQRKEAGNCTRCGKGGHKHWDCKNAVCIQALQPLTIQHASSAELTDSEERSEKE